MDLTFECKGFSGETWYSSNKMSITLSGVVLNGHVEASDIIEEYSAKTLLEEIGDEDIIKYLTGQGYVVAEK